MQCARARGRHPEMRCHAPVRIDLERWQRQHSAFDVGVRRALERAVEKPGIGGHLLDVFVRWHDQDRDSGGCPRRERSCERLRGGCEAGNDRRGSIERRLGGGLAEMGAEGKRGCRGHLEYMRTAHRSAQGRVSKQLPLSHADSLVGLARDRFHFPDQVRRRMRDPIDRIFTGMRVELDLQHVVNLLTMRAAARGSPGRAFACRSA